MCVSEVLPVCVCVRGTDCVCVSEVLPVCVCVVVFEYAHSALLSTHTPHTTFHAMLWPGVVWFAGVCVSCRVV